MSLAQITVMPEPDTRARRLYDWYHFADHLDLVRQMKKVKNTTLILYQIWPQPDDWQLFLERHQALHDDFSKAIGVSRRNFLHLDDKDESARRDWAFRNWDQHVAAHRLLGLT